MDEEWVEVKEQLVARRPLRLRWVAGAVAASLAALALAAALDAALPPPLPRSAPPTAFSGERARDHVVALAALGPRVAGSYENDVLAVALVADAVRAAASAAHKHNTVELDVHTASGNFSLDFLDGMNSAYMGVRSVVARVRAAGGDARAAGGGARAALLFNCHTDTVPDSPGASDDAAGCAVLLEVLRALVSRASPLRHDAVFLFNGAEENIMQGSHAFVTRHPWARHVRAFVNVEACGAGGRELLFQAGPGRPWLLEAYAAAAPRPFASSLAQELFESGALPADTDFRVFRDFGALPGYDFAWSSGGHAYHTRLDTAARVPPAALQRTGDNVLALATALGVSWSVSLRWSRGGWGEARAHRAAGLLLASAALALCLALRLRSGFVPLLWSAPPAAAELLLPRRARPGLRAALVAAAHAPALALTLALAATALRTLVPIAGRAGAGAVPADVPLAALVGALALLCGSWAPPLLVVSRGARRLARAALLAGAGGAALALLAGPPAPYSAEAPQRLMVLHTRRTLHAADGGASTDSVWWVPELDALTARTVRGVPALAGARAASERECARAVYCGAPYVLPAVSLVPRALLAPAPEPPAPRLRVSLAAARVNASCSLLTLEARGAAGARLAVALAAGDGARLLWADGGAAEAAPWRGRRVHFYLVHRAGERADDAWRLRALLEHAAAGPAPGRLAHASVAAHALWGERAEPLRALLAGLPTWVAPTGWPVDLHVLDV